MMAGEVVGWRWGVVAGCQGRVAGLLSSCGKGADGRARLGWNEVCDRICGTVFLQETVMRISLLSVTGVALLFLAGCQTKVYNQPPVGQNTVIHDRPLVTERTIER